MSQTNNDSESSGESKPKDPGIGDVSPITWLLDYIERNLIRPLPGPLRVVFVVVLLAIAGAAAAYWFFPGLFDGLFLPPPAPPVVLKYYGYMSNVDSNGQQYILEEEVELTETPLEGTSGRLTGFAIADVKRSHGKVKIRWELEGSHVENKIALSYRPEPKKDRHSNGVYYLQRGPEGSWMGSVIYEHHRTKLYLAEYVLIPKEDTKRDIDDVLKEFPQLKKRPLDITPQTPAAVPPPP
jgi:hypothetical protein